MTAENYKYWPFDVVLPAERRTDFHTALIALLEAAYAAGHAPYVNDTETVIGLGDSRRRAVEFIYRGGRNRFWEPWMTEAGKSIQLGPLLHFSESKCIVFNGITDVATFSIRWLDGSTLEESLQGICVYDRMNTHTALTVGHR